MKNYNFKKVKDFIDQHKNIISEASLGMNEDWGWTAQTVYSGKQYQIDLLEKDLSIAGIAGSTWATPTLEVIYFDGAEERIEVSEGDFSIDTLTQRLEQQSMVQNSLGVLTAPLQQTIGDINRKL